MLRTQIYLTETEREGISQMAKATGRKSSEIIRDAIDHYLNKHSAEERQSIIASTAGLWKDRDDLPDFEVLRSSFDRSFAP